MKLSWVISRFRTVSITALGATWSPRNYVLYTTHLLFQVPLGENVIAATSRKSSSALGLITEGPEWPDTIISLRTLSKETEEKTLLTFCKQHKKSVCVDVCCYEMCVRQLQVVLACSSVVGMLLCVCVCVSQRYWLKSELAGCSY